MTTINCFWLIYNLDCLRHQVSILIVVVLFYYKKERLQFSDSNDSEEEESNIKHSENYLFSNWQQNFLRKFFNIARCKQ